jgi:nucleotide-binding universal stress UspA family protein
LGQYGLPTPFHNALNHKEIMKILLAADGSPFTQIAARHLVNHLKWFAKPAEVHLFHVHPALPYPGAAAAVGKAALAKYQREESEAALAVAVKVLATAGVSHTSSWEVGEVTRQIAKYVKAHAIDLVVMGTHGHGALANLALGSVATKCIATLEVPIMIVRVAPLAKPLTRRERTHGTAPRKPRDS